MTYQTRLITLSVIDSMIVFISIFISKWILYPNLNFNYSVLISACSLLISHHVFARNYRLYKRAWEYASVGELIAIFKAVTLAVIVTALVQMLIQNSIYSRMLVITWMIHMLLIGGSRFAWRVYRDTQFKSKSVKKRTLIVGAGAAGGMVARQLFQNRDAELLPVAFIDDDTKKHGLMMMGLPTVGPIYRIADVVRKKRIEHIVIAIPSLGKKELGRIVELCTQTAIKTQTIPKIEDLMMGKVSINHFRDVQVEDLLGRDPVELDGENIAEYISDKVVLVTGAGGSIGSELCRQISRFEPAKVILLGHGENSIYEIHRELQNCNGNKIRFIPMIADIQDRHRMLEIMESERPDVVFHAAAHKHVPLMEFNPIEAVKNNVIGTRNVADAAEQSGVHTFVMISTDKAVNPTSVMGATKRIAEMIIQEMAEKSTTKFVAVRFGNVLGSRGSVIPLFKEQIRRGGPVTVTHPDMVRYFMTIPEASRLVIQAGALARGGEIFVLDMGEPVKIVDLARNLIRLSGYTEDEIRIEFTGMRPGEKLYEELLSENEVHNKQVFPDIYIGKSAHFDKNVIHDLIKNYHTYGPATLQKELLDIANYKKNTVYKVAVGK